MNKPRSFVIFKDGHEEDIFYYQQYSRANYVFATKSGVYVLNTYVFLGGGGSEFLRMSHISPNFSNDRHPEFKFSSAPEIKSVIVDGRIPYVYRIKGDFGEICGSIYAAPDATESEVHKLILEDLHIEYRKE